MGRFMTPDGYQASGGPSEPQSWNRYAYTRGDPVNRVDPSGQFDCATDWDPSECTPNPVSPTGFWMSTPLCGMVTYFSTPASDPSCWIFAAAVPPPPVGT